MPAADNGTDLSDRVVQYNQAQTLLIQDVAGAAAVRPRPPGHRQAVGADGRRTPLSITGQDDYPGDYFLDSVRIAPH